MRNAFTQIVPRGVTNAANACPAGEPLHAIATPVISPSARPAIARVAGDRTIELRLTHRPLAAKQ